MSDILGLFAKWPCPGQVKTRLAAETSPEFAARVAGAFLHDSLQRLTLINARRVLVFAPAIEEAPFARLASPHWELTPQADGNLGARMNAFLDQCLRAGAGRAVLVGTDSPTLPIEFVQQAFTLLHSHQVVLGPATDGGYYLIGCSTPAPQLFDGIDWGGSDVLARTVGRLGTLTRALLPLWYDVDTLSDWRMLRGHVAALRCAGLDPRIPATEALLGEADA
jgi:rSAM/selenodomain-associated transferase 1